MKITAIAMENFEKVQRKLEAFIRRYYLDRILKGSLVFLAIGILYFLIVSLIEYFFWLSSSGRMFLFWSFLVVELFLLFFFIGIPFLNLLRISGGIDQYQASEIIGRHFPEVNDKLKNLLQLKDENAKTELILASIEQRSSKLIHIPFVDAIDLKDKKKEIKFLVFPLLIVLAFLIAGHTDVLFGSFHRIQDYNSVYLKPAPFQFLISNNKLVTREEEDFKLEVKILGDVYPEVVKIRQGKSVDVMRQIAPGSFEYTFLNPKEDIEFQIISGEVLSETKELRVLKVPKITNLEMDLDYPGYTGLEDESLKGSGNFVVPEGTLVTWNFNSKNTNQINFNAPDSIYRIDIRTNSSSFKKSIRNNFPYALSSSNKNIRDFEPLQYEIKVIKDEYPKINVESKRDTLNTDIQYFKGDLSDDYGLKRLELVYFPENDQKSAKIIPINIANGTFAEFHSVFPGTASLEKGTNYTFYFRVFDNDAVNGSKSAQSEMFSYYKKTKEEKEAENLEEQNNTIDKFQDRLNDFNNSEEELKEFSQLEKEKENLNYNDRKRFEEFLKRQKQQNEMMEKYSDKLEENISKFEDEEVTPMEKELKERLKNNEKRLEENEELLKELKEYSEKIQKDDLGSKLEKLSKQNRNNQRSLEQILELTKQYYVEEKKNKLARDLEKLSKEQQEITNDPESNTSEKQQELNNEFQKFREEMDKLEEQNEELKRPKELGREKVDEEEIQKEQEDAKDHLEKGDKNNASEKQKNASDNMQKMSSRLQSMTAQNQMQELQADAETLRQILDNLIVFSFEQEDLLDDFKTIQQNNPNYASKLKHQSNLRENFKFIDDSLFALALKNPMIGERITDNITNIQFDLEKSLDRLSNNEIPQGNASQQYVVTGANNLANLLSDILNAMQQMMANPQMGQENGGEEMQLPDIIQKQQDIIKQMEQEMEQGKEQNQPGEEQEGNGEKMDGKLYEIYKQQQMLRMQIEKIQKENNKNSGKSSGTEDLMDQIEKQLLDKGFDEETIQRMKQLEYELLKYEKAQKTQGMDNKRKSETNQRNFENSVQDQIDRAKEYFNSNEILNRQILPLRQIYREKVKEYFGTSD